MIGPLVSAPDFEALYSQEPGKVRANANLPGQLVLPVNRLTVHAHGMEKWRQAIEDANPGYDPMHIHETACEFRTGIFGAESKCGKWNWKDWRNPEDYNPTHEFVTPYLQLSRAEAMKGSEQVVRSFQGGRPADIEGVGIAPDLAPKHHGPAPVTLVVAAQQGVNGAKKEVSLAKRMVGLGGK